VVANGAGNVYLHLNDTTALGASTNISEAWAGGAAWHSQVNVASATTLAGALNIAANQALWMDQNLDSGAHTTVANVNTTAAVLQENAHTGLVDWFQFGGNTFIVEAVNNTAANAAHTGLAANDMVVELTGIVDVSHYVHVAGI